MKVTREPSASTGTAPYTRASGRTGSARAPRRTGSAVAGACALVSALASCDGAPPDGGTTEAVYARPVVVERVLVVDRGETLGDVLIGIVPPSEWGDALMVFRDLADPRRIRAGSRITVLSSERENDVRQVEVALNPDESVVLTRSKLADGTAFWGGEKLSHPLTTDTVSASGGIATDLWRAVVGSEQLGFLSVADRARFIHELDRVFQWQIDFSVQIRSGDEFRFVAEREARPDGSTQSVRLLAAEIVNAGSPHLAVWFDPNGDGRGSYFDEEGQSVRRAFLLRPLEYRRISSRFSSSRFHPILKTWRAHRGVDYAADRGTPVMATGGGVVVSAGVNGGLGRAVEIRHPSGFVTRYGHLSGYARGVTAGAPVAQGQVIGYVGMTGLATGPHLHYEMIRGGRHVDPLSVDLPSDDPVPEDAREWDARRDERLKLLRSVPMPKASTSRADDAAGG